MTQSEPPVNNILRYFHIYLPINECIFNVDFYPILFLDFKYQVFKTAKCSVI